MEALKKNKFLLYAFGITLIVFASYFFFVSNQSDTTASGSIDTGSSLANSTIIQSLQELSSAQIPTAFFASAAWISLQNISAPIPSNTLGKSNLFAPINSQ